MTDAGKEAAVDLKPCPFCGGGAKVSDTGGTFTAVRCTECWATGREFTRAQWRDPKQAELQAVRAWDQRAASGEAGLAGYAGVKDAEVNKSLPTQGGGAGDRETQEAARKVRLWVKCGMPDQSDNSPTRDALKRDLNKVLDALQAALSEVSPTDLELATWALDEAHGRIRELEERLRAAPSEGGEPVAWLMRQTNGVHEYACITPCADSYIEEGRFTKEPLFLHPARPPAPSEPVEVTIFCPACSVPHVDEGEWATTRHHKTHQCQSCGHEWRPFPFATIGVAHPAPSEGGEPVAWRWPMTDLEGNPTENFDSTLNPKYAELIAASGADVRPLYEHPARPPAPSEEPLVGCVVVPREPTLRMVEAGFETGRVLARDDVKVVWHAMRAAAPAPDAIRGGEGALQAASRPSVPGQTEAATGSSDGEGA